MINFDKLVRAETSQGIEYILIRKINWIAAVLQFAAFIGLIICSSAITFVLFKAYSLHHSALQLLFAVIFLLISLVLFSVPFLFLNMHFSYKKIEKQMQASGPKNKIIQITEKDIIIRHYVNKWIVRIPEIVQVTIRNSDIRAHYTDLLKKCPLQYQILLQSLKPPLGDGGFDFYPYEVDIETESEIIILSDRMSYGMARKFAEQFIADTGIKMHKLPVNLKYASAFSLQS